MNEYRNQLQKIIEKSESTYDKTFTYLSAGLLVLFIGFIKDEKDFLLKCISLKYISYWVVLFSTFSLLINLISHRITIFFLQKIIRKIDENKNESINIDKKNNRIGLLNNIALVSFIISIILSLILIYNFFNLK